MNFNPRTPRGVRHIPARPVIEPAIISIHAPREGCDWALSGEGACITPFQSTHPARGATFSNCIQLESFVFQSTHPARGATPDIILGNMPVCISIHAPREGCDLVYSTTLTPPYIFQSTHPARGATRPLLSLYQLLVFQSTHPARGATFHFQLIKSTHGNFNPRTPRGVRQAAIVDMLTAKLFQSTHPARGATANFTKEQRVCLAQFAYLHKGKKAEHTKTNAPMLHEAFLYAFWVRTGRRRRVLLDFARYKIKGSSGR